MCIPDLTELLPKQKNTTATSTPMTIALCKTADKGKPLTILNTCLYGVYTAHPDVAICKAMPNGAPASQIYKEKCITQEAKRTNNANLCNLIPLINKTTARTTCLNNLKK